MSDAPLSAVLAAIGQIVTRLDRLEAGQSRLDESQSKLQASQSRLEEQQTRLRTDLMARMDRLQNGLDDLRDRHVVDWGNVERAERIARGASDEVRALAEQVSALTRFVHRLEAQIAQLRGDG